MNTPVIQNLTSLHASSHKGDNTMSTANALDADLQDLTRIFTHGDGHDLLGTQPGSDAWAENAEDVLGALLQLGWLPPTHTEAVKRDVKLAWEADEANESFRALGAAAEVLDVELVDPALAAA